MTSIMIVKGKDSAKPSNDSHRKIGNAQEIREADGANDPIKAQPCISVPVRSTGKIILNHGIQKSPQKCIIRSCNECQKSIVKL